MSLSKNNLKLITSLQQKKYRQKHNLFVAEGVKVVEELLSSTIEVSHVFTTDESFLVPNRVSVTIVSDIELKK
jgi:TrmH family RNA methyltransferase